ncbi:MAG TPA: OmpA family protein [Chloroflexota bacterium]|nr:OmpA family protein [Chloroflexota bacterium]
MRTVGRLATWVLLATGVTLGINGCLATQSYVDEHDNELRAALTTRIDALERESKATRADLTALTARVATAESRITQAQATADQAESRAEQAQGRADQAQNRADKAQAMAGQVQAKAEQVDAALERARANRFKRENVHEIAVLFEASKAGLSRQALATLDRVVSTMAENPTYTLNIVGYPDASGSDRDNANLSWQRVEIVRRRLTERGVDMNRVYFIGTGEEAFKARTGRAKPDRQVVIHIFKPAD